MMLARYEPHPPATVLLPSEVGLAIEPDRISDRDYELLKSSFDTWRDTLLCKLLKCTGLRAGELLRVTTDLYSLAGPEYYLLALRSKRAERDPIYARVFLPSVLGVELRNYMQGNGIPVGQPMFQGRIKGKHLTLRALLYSFEKASARAGITPPITPHNMRHLYGSVLLTNGVNPATVAVLMGHANSRTTIEWYYDLTRDERREIARMMSP